MASGLRPSGGRPATRERLAPHRFRLGLALFALVTLAACGTASSDPGTQADTDDFDGRITHTEVEANGEHYDCLVFEGYQKGGLWCERNPK